MKFGTATRQFKQQFSCQHVRYENCVRLETKWKLLFAAGLFREGSLEENQEEIAIIKPY